MFAIGLQMFVVELQCVAVLSCFDFIGYLMNCFYFCITNFIVKNQLWKRSQFRIPM